MIHVSVSCAFCEMFLNCSISTGKLSFGGSIETAETLLKIIWYHEPSTKNTVNMQPPTTETIKTENQKSFRAWCVNVVCFMHISEQSYLSTKDPNTAKIGIRAMSRHERRIFSFLNELISLLLNIIDVRLIILTRIVVA